MENIQTPTIPTADIETYRTSTAFPTLINQTSPSQNPLNLPDHTQLPDSYGTFVKNF